VGYQYGSPAAVHPDNGQINQYNDINSFYVDGVSITQGSPRQHVWTLMAGVSGVGSHNMCPCSDGSTQTVQSFIGQDYFCESGCNDTWSFGILYTLDPLWDGLSDGCGTLESNCCSIPGLPWFHKVLNSNTTDYIELRVCSNEDTDNEDVPVGFYEIYVK
jgi:hypothetical protein